MQLKSTGTAGEYLVTYTPLIVGSHEVGIIYDGEHIVDSPFVVKAYDANQVVLSTPKAASVNKQCEINSECLCLP